MEYFSRKRKERKVAFREMNFFVVGCDFMKNLFRLKKLIPSQIEESQV